MKKSHYNHSDYNHEAHVRKLTAACDLISENAEKMAKVLKQQADELAKFKEILRSAEPSYFDTILVDEIKELQLVASPARIEAGLTPLVPGVQYLVELNSDKLHSFNDIRQLLTNQFGAYISEQQLLDVGIPKEGTSQFRMKVILTEDTTEEISH